MKVYAYLRCSTDVQDVNHGRLEIENYVRERGLEGEIEWTLDTAVSGSKAFEKRKLQEVIDNCASGDIVIVQELSRLSRNPRDVLNLRHIFKNKEVEFHAVKENLTWGRDVNMEANMKTMLFSMFAEAERDRISARVKSGIKAKRAGRPETIERAERRRQVLELYNEGLSRKEISDRLNITTVQDDLTFWRKEGEISKEKRGRKVIPPNAEELQLQFNEGKSWGEVSNHFGVSKTKIWRVKNCK